MISYPKIPSPKQVRARNGWDSFFPYYAGYPGKFASAILGMAQLPPGGVVLDPWNGTGTTTLAASRMGFRSIGCDLNPVMAIVARARAISPDDADSIIPLAGKITKSAARLTIPIDQADPLLAWFGYHTTHVLRAIETSLREHLVSSRIFTDVSGLSSMSGLAAAFYVALFSVSKHLAAPFRVTNPTWMRRRREAEQPIEIASEQVIADFSRITQLMAEHLEAERQSFGLIDQERFGHVELRVADSARTSMGSQIADFVLGSPPYCTRIDYTAATRIELALLAPLIKVDPRELSRQMTGSIRVPEHGIARLDDWGSTCNTFLGSVESHPSKASAGYYLKTHLDYFDKLYRSIGNISAALKPSSAAVLVVQDSFYKEVHNDLPKIVAEMAGSVGLKFIGSQEFRPRTSFAHLNRFARASRSGASPTEAVLCFAN